MDNALCERYTDLVRKKRQLDAEQKAVNADLRDLEEAVLAEFAADGNVDRITVNGMNLKPQRTLWASCNDGQYDAACDALAATGYGDYVQRRFNAQSLSALVREMERDGMSVEEIAAQWDGLVNVTEKFTISATEAHRGTSH